MNRPFRGAVLRNVMKGMTTGALKPLAHTRWPIAEAGAAMDFMRSARHIGKNVLALPAMVGGRLRPGRTYLVTGGLGGIGIAVAGWLADRGGRRDRPEWAQASRPGGRRSDRGPATTGFRHKG